MTATDTKPGPLTFKFNSVNSARVVTVVRNFNIGSNNGGVWTAQPFTWADIEGEGTYAIQVTALDFASGEYGTKTVFFTFTSLVNRRGKLNVVSTANPLVGLAAIPACPTGTSVRASFTQNRGDVPITTSYQPCGGTVSSYVYLGGMQASSTYTVAYQTLKDGMVTTYADTAKFRTGRIPHDLGFPAQTLIAPPSAQSYAVDRFVLHSYINLGNVGVNYQPASTDLSGNINWYYDGGSDYGVQLLRPLAGAHFTLFQSAISWDTKTETGEQVVREIDLAGNIVHETNIGLLQKQLRALGDTNLGACGAVRLPASPGASCLTAFSHDAIRLPAGYTAFICNVEKIFPPGTQGDTSGLNVDVIGDAVIVVDANWNAVWYFDAFQHDGGGNQFDINRPAVLGETCAQNQGGCPPLFLAGTTGVTTLANDWLHSNSIQYRASDGNIILSSRHQDWVVKIDFNNGTGTGNLLWRMGVAGDFTINNVNNDAYPWFSHQHDAGFESNGQMTVFDNGNTRVAQLGPQNSRGFSLSVDENALTVTPVFEQDLGYYAFALGSAQLLDNGNYHFQPGIVPPNNYDYSLEFFPTAGTTFGTEVYNLQGATASYRSFRLPDLYTPPTI